jgi:hypothetical protein
LRDGSKPGARPNITVERDGRRVQIQPTLARWPAIKY